MKKSVLLLVLAAALGVRLAAVFEFRKFPVFDHPQLDEMEYAGWASSIASGKLLWSYIPIHSPGYAFFLAASEKLFGAPFLPARILQSVLSAFTVFLVFALARRLLDERSAMISAALAALFWPLVYFQARLLPPTLNVLFLLLSLLAVSGFERKRIRAGFFSGLCLGLSAVFWPLSLALAPGLIIWLALREGFKKSLKPAGFFLTGLVIILAPMTIQNYRAEKDWVLLQKNFGLNFYLGNNPKSPGTPYLRPGGEWDRLQSWPARESGIERPSEQSGFYLKKWRQWALAHPGSQADLLVRKAKLLFDNREIIASFDPLFYRQQMLSLRVCAVNSALVISLGLVGLLSMRSGRNRFSLLALSVMCLGLGPAATLVSSRYRLGFMALLLVPAGHAVSEIYGALKSKSELRFWGLLMTAAVLITVSLLPWPLIPEQAGYEFVHLGQAFKESGQYHRAEESFNQALRFKSSHAGGWLGMAQLHQLQGKTDQARADIMESIKADPGYALAHVVLGAILLEQDQAEQAAREFQTAISLRPQYLSAWSSYAEALIRAGQYQQAQNALQRMAALDPELPELHLLAARISLAQGDRGSAAPLLREYLRLRPGDSGAAGILKEIENQ